MVKGICTLYSFIASMRPPPPPAKPPPPALAPPPRGRVRVREGRVRVREERVRVREERVRVREERVRVREKGEGAEEGEDEGGETIKTHFSPIRAVRALALASEFRFGFRCGGHPVPRFGCGGLGLG
jgi:hypothetical protein